MHVTHTTANMLISCVDGCLFTVYVNVIMMELPFVIGLYTVIMKFGEGYSMT